MAEVSEAPESERSTDGASFVAKFEVSALDRHLTIYDSWAKQSLGRETLWLFLHHFLWGFKVAIGVCHPDVAWIILKTGRHRVNKPPNKSALGEVIRGYASRKGPLLIRLVSRRSKVPAYRNQSKGSKADALNCWNRLLSTSSTFPYIYCIYGAASPTPPLWMGHGPPPLWLWGCGGALLVSDAADFLWFLVPPPPHGPPPPCGVGNGGVVVVVVVVVEVVVVVVIW